MDQATRQSIAVVQGEAVAARALSLAVLIVIAKASPDPRKLLDSLTISLDQLLDTSAPVPGGDNSPELETLTRETARHHVSEALSSVWAALKLKRG